MEYLGIHNVQISNIIRIWSNQSTKPNQIKTPTFRWDNPNLNHKDETSLNCIRIGHTQLTPGFFMATYKPPNCEACGQRLEHNPDGLSSV